jgi:hypothetical protein
MAEFPMPTEGILVTHFIVSSDVGRARRSYADVLGGEVLLDGEPPRDRDHVSSFLNIRVADIHPVYRRLRRTTTRRYTRSRPVLVRAYAWLARTFATWCQRLPGLRRVA